MSSNKNAKEELIRRYGAECFIEKLHLRKNDTPRRYKSRAQRKKMKQLTFHHICMKKDGGRATVENGALLSAENHAWFHKQNPSVQGYMNALFQEYKRQADELLVTFEDEIDFPFEITVMEFCVPERRKYDRTKKKQEDKKFIDEYQDELEK